MKKLQVDIETDATEAPERVETAAPDQVPKYLTSPPAFVIHYVRMRIFTFGGLLLLVTSAAAVAVCVQYAMKLLVDAIALGPQASTGAWYALYFFVALIAFESVLWRLSGWFGCRAAIGTGVDIRLDLLDYITGHPMRFFQENLAGSLGHRITAQAGHFGALLTRLVWNISPPVVDFIGAAIIFFYLDWRMTVALAIYVAVTTGGLVMVGIWGGPYHQAYAKQAGIVSGELTDTIGNIWAVKAFSARARERQRLWEAFSKEARIQRAGWMFMERVRIFHDLMLWTMAGAMLAWALYLWQTGRITPGDVVIVSALTFRILHGSRDLALALADVAQNMSFIGETLELVGRPHLVADKADAKALIRLGGGIAFENVSFGYASDQPLFSNFNLEIPAGQKVGIVGPSGAGKSTLVNLVQRLHDIHSGRVTIDNQRLSELRQDSLRASIAVVPQEVSLFHRSLMDNIRFGRHAATDDEVYAAARAAYCDDFIRQMPEGYETRVGERGTRLSGGQRQRIGIARALLKDAPILILDEATASLDTESEHEIQRALWRLMRDRTVLAVAHRLSTLSGFDRILVMLNGEIVEDGSPEELRRRGGVFERMWRLQAEGLSVDDMAAPGRPAKAEAGE